MAITLRQNTSGSADYITGSNLELIGFHPEQGVSMKEKNFIQYEDDFLGDVLADEWSGGVGSGGTATLGIQAAQNGGWVRLLAGSGNGGIVTDGSVLTLALNYRAADGGLYMETRAKLGSVANCVVNIGFTDMLATTALENPFTVSTATVTAQATDAACFVFDTAATAQTFKGQGVANNTATALVATGITPVAATFNKFAVILDTSGGATFYIDDALVASVANAVTPTALLTPVFSIMSRAASTKSMDVDYLWLAKKRS